MTIRRSLLVLLGVALLAVGARAGDEPPPYGASDLALEDEGLDEGWEIVYEDLEGTPGEALEAWTTEAAASVGIDEGDLFSEIRILSGPEGAAATIQVVEVDVDPKGLAKVLADRGKPLGYEVLELGHPSRLVVVAAPEAYRKAVRGMQVRYAVEILSRIGFERLEAGSRVGAVDYARGGRAIDPKASPPLVLLGMSLTQEEKWDDAIEAFRVAFGDGTTEKSKGRFAMRGYAHYGYACLQKKDASFDREARDAFAKCIALEGEASQEDPKYIQRYNYACALARLNAKEDAFAQLEKAVEYARRRMGTGGVTNWIRNAVYTDEDWKILKDDPRFDRIVKEVTGGVGERNPLEGL